MEEKRKRSKTCTHGEAPADVLWGVDEQRTTPGVQQHISYLSARLTFEEAAQTMCRSVPIGMSRAASPELDASGGRSVGGFRRPAGHRLTGPGQASAEPAVHERQPARRRLSGCISNWMACWRGCDGAACRWRKRNVQRKGDVYREIKAGAVFRAERGPQAFRAGSWRAMWIRQRQTVCAMWLAAPLRAYSEIGRESKRIQC